MDIVPQETQLNDVPLLPLKDVVIFPGTHTGLAFGRELTRLAIEDALAGNNLVVFVTQRDPEVEDVEPDDMYEIGTLGIIRQVLRSETDVKVVAEGLARVKILRFSQEKPYYRVDAERLQAVES